MKFPQHIADINAKQHTGEMTAGRARRERARSYERQRAGSFADRHPFLAIAAIVAFLAVGGLSFLTTMALKSKIEGQAAEDRAALKSN
jgi:hypothetical protein